MSDSGKCQCPCGATQFSVRGAPLFRAFCHCTICQRFNDAPFADISVFRGRDVDKPEKRGVVFRAHRPPPNVQRGTCAECEKPAIELFTGIGVPKLVIVPTKNIEDESFIIDPSLHVFYERRVAEVEDDLPKFQGYVRSQLAFVGAYVRSAVAGRR